MGRPYSAGTRVEKINADPGDIHPDGAVGEVVGHDGPLRAGTRLDNGEVLREDEYAYFVKWDDFPVPVFIRGCRVRRLQ